VIARFLLTADSCELKTNPSLG